MIDGLIKSYLHPYLNLDDLKIKNRQLYNEFN